MKHCSLLSKSQRIIQIRIGTDFKKEPRGRKIQEERVTKGGFKT